MCLGIMGLSAGLAGCETGNVKSVLAGPFTGDPASVKMERVADANIAAAPLFIVGFDGLPQRLTQSMASGLQREADSRKLVLCDETKARYLARGYFSALTVDEDTHFVYVWDVADLARHQSQRVSDTVVVHGTASDPWTLLTPDVAAELSSKSADDLADVLSNTPEARRSARS